MISSVLNRPLRVVTFTIGCVFLYSLPPAPLYANTAILVEGSIHYTNYVNGSPKNTSKVTYELAMQGENWRLKTVSDKESNRSNVSEEWVFSDGQDLFWNTFADKTKRLSGTAGRAGHVYYESFLTIVPVGQERAISTPWPKLVLLAHGLKDSVFKQFVIYPGPVARNPNLDDLKVNIDQTSGGAVAVFLRSGMGIRFGQPKPFPAPFDRESLAGLLEVTLYTNLASRPIPLSSRFLSTFIQLDDDHKPSLETNNVAVIQVDRVSQRDLNDIVPEVRRETGVLDARFNTHFSNAVESSTGRILKNVNYVLPSGSQLPVRSADLEARVSALVSGWRPPKKPISSTTIGLTFVFILLLSAPFVMAFRRFHNKKEPIR